MSITQSKRRAHVDTDVAFEGQPFIVADNP